MSVLQGIFPLAKNVCIAACVSGAFICGIGDGRAALAQQVAVARPASPADVDFKLSDARNIGANSVRFSAAQFTRESLTVVLFGATDASWEKLKAAVQEAVYEGYPVRMVFIGPVDEPRSIEIYAKGDYVTNPIDPETITKPELVKLLKDVTREYYR